MSNADLLARSATGEQAAWDQVVRRFNGLVWSVARGFRLQVGETDDAVQNTWLRLVENLDRISDPDHLGSWLATTTRRECLQVLRRRSRTGYPTDSVESLQLPDAAPDLDAGLLADERDAALWAAVHDAARPLLGPAADPHGLAAAVLRRGRSCPRPGDRQHRPDAPTVPRPAEEARRG